MSCTLLHILEKRAAEEGGKTAFTFFKNPPCTYEQLWREIDRVGNYLLKLGVKPGEKVLIAIPNSEQFFFAFYGVQWVHGVSVPLFPGAGSRRLLQLARLSGARFLLVSTAYPPARLEEIRQASAGSSLRLLFLEDAVDASVSAGRRVSKMGAVSAGDIAFIQFTSGSSGDPRGVQLSHANLVTNIEQMIAGLEITVKDIFVSWLPVYHDMGLILMTMVPFYLGLDVVLLPTGLNYLQTWLQMIAEHRATFTAAPDFAYRMCLIYIREGVRYDLSSLEVALNAAEPVRSATIRHFEERFAIENVLLPAYGLAEATVGVCGWQRGRKIKIDERGFVSVGRPFPGVEIRIAGDDNEPKEKELEQGQTGHIQVRSPANTIGYLNNRAANEKLFTADGYIVTGDLGYVDAEGFYYIEGRDKNIIIQGGVNIAAREVEEWVDEFPFVRRSAAVGIERGDRSEGEQVYIFIEIKLSKSQLQEKTILPDLVIRVVEHFKSIFGFNPGRVYLVKPGTIPMTANGKIRYGELKKQYLEGILRDGSGILFPSY